MTEFKMREYLAEFHAQGIAIETVKQAIEDYVKAKRIWTFDIANKQGLIRLPRISRLDLGWDIQSLS
jgi:hypothetical protein